MDITTSLLNIVEKNNPASWRDYFLNPIGNKAISSFRRELREKLSSIRGRGIISE
jgi:hypothetical protein